MLNKFASNQDDQIEESKPLTNLKIVQTFGDYYLADVGATPGGPGPEPSPGADIEDDEYDFDNDHDHDNANLDFNEDNENNFLQIK